MEITGGLSIQIMVYVTPICALESGPVVFEHGGGGAGGGGLIIQGPLSSVYCNNSVFLTENCQPFVVVSPQF